MESEKAAGPAPEASQGFKKSKKRRSKTRRKNQPNFDLEAELRRSFALDLTRVDGIKVLTAQVILSELGPDLSALPNEDHFASWLELSPRRDITGGDVIKQKSRESKNRVAGALRMAAESLSRSDSYLGARYRQLRGADGRQEGSQSDGPIPGLSGISAADQRSGIRRPGGAYYEGKYAARDMTYMCCKIAELGMKLVPAA